MQKLYNECITISSEKIEDESVDLVITDPPYKVTSRGGYTSAGGMLLNKEMRNGNGGFKNNTIKFSEWMPIVFSKLKESGHCYVFTNNKNLKDTIVEMQTAGFTVIKTLVWAKNNKIMSQAYMSQTEFIVFARKGKFVKINNCGTSDLLQFENPTDKAHPSEKPVELLYELLENSSNVGDTVYDPFMGSGSTGVVALNRDRHFIGSEIDGGYFGDCSDRLEIFEGWQC